MHLLIMGAPGSGKGSYAVELKERYGIPHISTGDMFRKAISEKTPTGLIAQGYIDQGKLVPDEVTNQIVKERLQEADCHKGFLLDGFPRNIDQAEALSSILKEIHMELDAAINLEVEDQLIIRRIVNRRLCTNCDKSYNMITYPPQKEGICDVCGAPLYTRKDDNAETISSRLNVYNAQTKPLVEYYQKLGVLISIDSNGTIEAAVNDIIARLEGK